MTQYLMDTNAFIDSFKRYYQLPMFKRVWSWILNNKHILVTDHVYKELLNIDDDLAKIIEDNYKNLKVDESCSISEYQAVQDFLFLDSRWSYANGEGMTLWNNNIDKADPWLISYAMHSGATIITHEKNGGPNKGANSTQEPKIPFVAEKLNVQTIHIWDLFVKEKADFNTFT